MTRGSLLVLSLAVALLCSSSIAAAGFCAEYVKTTGTCSKPAPRDDIDLSAYQGRWFEIGVSTLFKVQEIGLSCVTANYTATGQNKAGENVVKVVNRGYRGVGLPRIATMSSIWGSSVAIGRLLRRMCRATVKAAAANAPAAAIATVEQNAQVIDEQLAAIQRANSVAWQENRPAQAPGLPQIRQTIRGAVRRIVGATAAIRLAQLRLSLAAPVARMQIAVLAGGMRNTALGMLGPSATLVAAPFVVKTKANIVGSATQEKTSAASLRVSFFGVPANNVNYQVIRLEGNSTTGYSRAVVYSCSSGRTSLWILSREPSMADDQVDTLLTSLEADGVKLPGYNVFVRTNQEPAYCNDYLSSIY